MSAAALLGLVGYFVLPSVLPVFGMTTLAFPLIAGAAILDTLGSVAERRDGLLRAAGWLCLAAGGLYRPLASPRRSERPEGHL